MKNRKFSSILTIVCAVLAFTVAAKAQSRPRRVNPPDTLLGPEPKSPPASDKNAPLLDVKPAKPVGDAPASSNASSSNAARRT